MKPSAFYWKTPSDGTFTMVLGTLFPSLVALFVTHLHSTFIQLCKPPLPVISSFMNLQWGITLLSIITATNCSKIIPSVAFYTLSKQLYCQHLARFVGLHCHLRKEKKKNNAEMVLNCSMEVMKGKKKIVFIKKKILFEDFLRLDNTNFVALGCILGAMVWEEQPYLVVVFEAQPQEHLQLHGRGQWQFSWPPSSLVGANFDLFWLLETHEILSALQERP